MNNKLSLLGVLALAGCCFFNDPGADAVTAVSPDGKNEIRLWLNPLAYEVCRGGASVVAKSEIGMKVDGKCLTAMKRSGDRFPVVEKHAVSGMVSTPLYKKARIRSARHV